MFKFETKSTTRGRLQICVSKEAPANCKARAALPIQKPSNEKDKFSRQRPHTTPSIIEGIVNLETTERCNRSSGKARRLNSAIVDIADHCCRSSSAAAASSNRWKGSTEEVTETEKQQLIAESVHPRTAVRRPSRRSPWQNDDDDHDDDHGDQRDTVSVGRETADPENTEQTKESEGIETSTDNRAKSQDGRARAEGSSSLAGTSRLETADVPVPKRMSLLEQKRLQWATERAQMAEWNPWGRPGGGAPSHQINHNIDINSQAQIDCMHKSNYFTSNRFPVSGRRPAEDSISTCKHGRQLPPLNQKASEEDPPSVQIFQAAAAFSAMGYLADTGLVRNCACEAWREEERKQWLEDLERQRTEQQQQRKLQDKSYYNKNLNDMNIAENMNNMDASSSKDFGRTSALPLPPSSPSRSRAPSNLNDRTMPHVSQTSDVDTANYDNNNMQRTFLRGANIPMDAETQKELARKKQRALEHRKAIQSQLEDRLNQKEEEKARQKREERLEELRLCQDRELLEKEYLLEQQKVKAKQNAESELRRKVYNEPPVTMEPVKQPHHTHHLPDVLEGTKEIEIKSIEMPKEVDLTDCPEEHVKNSLIQHAPYVNNRILTPTKFRDKHLLMRDFSTQTDSAPLSDFPARKNKSTITTSLSSRKREDEGGGRHRNRNRGNRMAAGNRESRPHWGANRPVQNYKTQSEKYLSGDVTRLPNQRRHFQEYYEKSEHLQGFNKVNPRLSVKKTRSSAEHQRKLLAQEESLAFSTQRSLSLRRQMETASSEAESAVHDGSNNTADNDQCLLTTRHQRRKWQSPSRQEVPNFYTDTPHLPDVRNVRRGLASNNGRPSKDFSPSRGGLIAIRDQPDNPQQERTTTPQTMPVFRSDSPPVPALRHRLQHGPPNVDILAAAMRQQTSIVDRTSADDASRRSTAMAVTYGGGLLPSSGDRSESAVSFPETDDCSIDLVQRPYNAPLHIASAEDDDQRSEILNKMTLIRQGLVLKQREVAGLLDTADVKATDDNT